MPKREDIGRDKQFNIYPYKLGLDNQSLSAVDDLVAKVRPKTVQEPESLLDETKELNAAASNPPYFSACRNDDLD